MGRNPILIELTRGVHRESVHCGAIAVVRASGEPVCVLGDTAAPVFPRSAIKPLQALPLVETGAADRFGLGAPEIAIACGSHSGTPRHVAIVEGMLARAGLSATALACGVHEPIDAAAAQELAKAGAPPSPLHHNCSGKHAGMLATAVHLGEPTATYWQPDHPVQKRIARVLEDLCGIALGPEACGIDGCSAPNWAVPLERLAQAFARVATGEGLDAGRKRSCQRIVEACWAHPDLVAGPGRLDTLVMQRLRGKVLIKGGAEGVCCGAFPGLAAGFALKIDDGAKRAADAVAAHLVARLYPQARGLGPPKRLTNWRGIEVGEMRASPALAGLLDQLA